MHVSEHTLGNGYYPITVMYLEGRAETQRTTDGIGRAAKSLFPTFCSLIKFRASSPGSLRQK